MYCNYQDREELEDELYREEEEDSEGSEVNSELEFHLYSQLHYSSNAGEMEEQEGTGADSQQLEAEEKPGDGDRGWKDSERSRHLSRDTGGLRRHPKEHRELEQKTKRLDEKKKVESDPKGRRLSSSFIPEVIVIDSSSDVISISEDDTDDGVCAFKVQKSHPMQSSTPAQQAIQKRKRSPSLGSVVDSSSSESEESSSSSESESDSDALENWMILGPDQQDGDQCISLNLEGASDSNADDEDEDSTWLVSTKDREAQICNRDKGARMPVNRMSNRYYTNKNVTCRNCNKTGHLSKNCPTPKVMCCFLCGTPGHRGNNCPNKHCNNCGLPGHLYESCCEKAYWYKQCHRCGMTGHFLDACPEIWRQYHITTRTGPPKRRKGEDHGRAPPYCYNCSRKHFGHECTQRRMYNGTYPATPFINYYDTLEDIRRREHKMKQKVIQLKESGLFPTSSQTPLTPGPPKKRQKTNHYNNHHQPYHETHKTPNSHNPNHIRFSNDKPWSATKLKTKADKHQQQGTGSSVKEWKPKREVPATRGPLPPAKLAFGKEDDFPRGGGNEEMKEKVKRKKKKNKQVFRGAPEALFQPQADTHRASYQARRKAGKRAAKRSAAEMYPTDENLFIIKQRKRKR